VLDITEISERTGGGAASSSEEGNKERSNSTGLARRAEKSMQEDLQNNVRGGDSTGSSRGQSVAGSRSKRRAEAESMKGQKIKGGKVCCAKWSQFD